MIYTHNIHPIIVSIGPIDLYWYGAMYAISFLLIDYLMKREVVRDTAYEFNVSFIDQLVFIMILSVVIGGRLVAFWLDGVFIGAIQVKLLRNVMMPPSESADIAMRGLGIRE